MNDQAASLRQLKQRIQTTEHGNLSSPEEYLKQLPRPCRFTSIAMIPIYRESKTIPPMQQWLPEFLDKEKRACVWDQAGLFSAGTLFLETNERGFPVFQQIETSRGPILAFPRVSSFPGILHSSDQEKIRFLQSLDNHIGSAKEFWVTLPKGSIRQVQALIHAVDMVFVITPDTREYILLAYETIKGLHLSGFFSPIGLIVEKTEPTSTETEIFNRINSVANTFLSLDLHLAGVIISDNDSQEKVRKISVRKLIDGVTTNSRDFSSLFAERLFFPSPGDMT